jgi:hypothetical protein
MRVVAAAAAAVIALVVALVVVVFVWAPGRNDHLKALVDEVALPGASSLDCEWGASSYDSEPRSWYGCWQYVPDSLGHAGRAVLDRLAARGFTVSLAVPHDGHAVRLTGRRGADVVCVDVLERGFANGRNTAPEEIDPSPGEVFVDIWTVEPRAPGQPRCGALPAFENV